MEATTTDKKPLTQSQLSGLARKMDYLAQRWDAEKQYEDFNDYVVAAKKALPRSAVFVSLTKSPFKLTFTHGTDKHTFTVTTTKITHTVKS